MTTGFLVAVYLSHDGGFVHTPPATSWTMHTIHSGPLGADGVALADMDGDGDLDVATPWEQSQRTTLSLQPADPTDTWPTVLVSKGSNIGAAEDCTIADVDGDGRPDIISASEAPGSTRKLVIHFAPDDVEDLLTENAWTQVVLDDSVGVQHWMQVRFADLDGDGTGDIIAGGRVLPATLGYFTSATPRTAASWTYTEISDVGWTMSIVPIDMDGDEDLDVVINDRLFDDENTDNLGARWLENDGSGGTWTNHTIHKHLNEGDPKFLHVIDATHVIDTSSNENQNRSALRTWDGDSWETTAITQPDRVGRVHDVELCDIDGDEVDDYVFSYSNATPPLSGVVWVNAADGTRNEISGPAGTKFDNVLCHDFDQDGDLDVLTSEQIDQLGIVWYENGRL